jgi:hypothetical protein
MSNDIDMSLPALEFSPPLSPVRTNTLIVTGLPPAFFQPVVLNTLKACFAAYGTIHSWVPLKNFYRAIVVYYHEDDAELAKQEFDGFVIGATNDRPETTLRVWRADPTDLEQDPDSQHLHPPALEKNFLISPPGSPPVGWEQVKEEPPNATPLADDLIVALRKLEIQAEFSRSKLEGRNGVEVLIDPEEGHGIGVYVEDCDWVDKDDMDVYGDDERSNGEGWAYDVSSRYRMGPGGALPAEWRPSMPTTSRPPMSISF